MTREVAVPISVVLATIVALVSPAAAVPFRPDVVEQLVHEGRLDAVVAGIEDAVGRGLDRAPATARGWLPMDGGGDEMNDHRAIVILVDFSDNQANQGAYPPEHYEELLFSEGSCPTGSMRDWYLENSYGRFRFTGEVTVWLRMPQTYAYYVDGQAGGGEYPRNAQKLVEDAVIAADPMIDFSRFDNDGPDGIPNSGDDDGYVDALFVVHAGPGREETGRDTDIHSHSWATVEPVPVDGVSAFTYTMQPENGKIGVFGHEFAHLLGLPDLYDVDYSSSGVGDWCMMSFGAWMGGGERPVHFLAWCKKELGFLDYEAQLVNESAVAIPQVETSPTAYAIWTGGYPEQQYFTIENRQRTGFDSLLPGDGLIICHVDQGVWPWNSDEDRPLIAVEQADGLNELSMGGASDSGDPWPGSAGNRDFTDLSNPNTRSYDGRPTQVAVRNISDSGPAMSADLEVENAAILVPSDYWIAEIEGNGDGDIDPGEEWELTVAIHNRGLASGAATGILTSDHPDVTILAGASAYGSIGAEEVAVGDPPFRFILDQEAVADGLAFEFGVEAGLPGGEAGFDLVLGVDDPLGMFRWTHAAVHPWHGDQWHISTHRNHTPGGSYSWKCGGPNGEPYADYRNGALLTAPLPLASVRALTFWQWIDAEDDANQTAWDGGVIEVSVDGGSWTQIEPSGGYPYTIITNPDSPFPPGTRCFSGVHDWTHVRVDLTGLAGDEARLRFRFGTDLFVTEEGWYIDDVAIEGAVLSSGGADSPEVARLRLAAPRPNPSSTSSAIRFRQPAGRSAELAIVDVSGRRVRRWFYPVATGATDREMHWDGLNEAGAPVASGIYFVRLRSGPDVKSERMIRLR